MTTLLDLVRHIGLTLSLGSIFVNNTSIKALYIGLCQFCRHIADSTSPDEMDSDVILIHLNC